MQTARVPGIGAASLLQLKHIISDQRAVSVVMTSQPDVQALTMDDIRIRLGPGAKRIQT
jgi:hypothetical protein